MLKNITVKIAVVVLSLLFVKPIEAADSKNMTLALTSNSETLKDDGKVISPFCNVVFIFCSPPKDPGVPGSDSER